MSRSPVPPPPAGASEPLAGQPTSNASHQATASVAPSVRAQLLAAEHYSLLATRSTTQSEVLSRITTLLMLVSASIVSLALIGQATRFDRRFITFALVLLGMVLMIGALTQMRLANAALEDLGHVIGMNRLRAAYVELDPGLERYLVTSAHDDDPGIWQTYNHLMGPNPIWQPFASSTTFIMLVNAGLTNRCIRRAGSGSTRRTRPARRHGGGSMRLGLPWHLRSAGGATSPAYEPTVCRAVSRARHRAWRQPGGRPGGASVSGSVDEASRPTAPPSSESSTGSDSCMLVRGGL
jgi:hypothetical protein